MMEATEIYAIGQELKTLNDQELAFIKGFISGIQATDKTEDTNNEKEESDDDSTN